MTAKAGRQGAAAILTPKTARTFHQIVNRLPIANLFSWDPGLFDISQEYHSLRSAPQMKHMAHLGLCSLSAQGQVSSWSRHVSNMHDPHWTVCSKSTLSPELLKPGKDTKYTAHLCLYPCRAPENLSKIVLGTAWSTGPIWDGDHAKHPGDWAVQIWEAHFTWAVANSVWAIHCEHFPHMPVVFAVSLPPQNTTEQLSLSKCPPLL